MSAIRRPRPSGLQAFWKLLDAIEATTRLEFQAVRVRDLHSMKVLFEQKQDDFVRLHVLGRRLGMSRQNPELNRRLLALEAVQSRLADEAGSEVALLRSEWQEADLENNRLRSLKRAYVSDTMPSDFQAEG